MRRARGRRYDEAPRSLSRPPTRCAVLADLGTMSRPYACVKPVVAVLMRLFFRLEVKNPEHVPLAGPVLLVANHSSLLDPPLVGGGVPRPASVLAQAEPLRM